jgi:geranylgeranyl diphosphate synthase type II
MENSSQHAPERAPNAFGLIERFCAACRALVLDELQVIVSEHGWQGSALDHAVLTYPLRPSKALRPSLCLAVARVLGAADQGVLRSATVVELLHNAFLVHDDVEDESLLRRGEPTLQQAFGLPIAINTADAMFSLGFSALLANTNLLGLRLSLEIFELIAGMLRTTVGGQAIELGWIRDNHWQFPGSSHHAAYEDLVVRKTATYSFIAPVELGLLVGGASATVRAHLSDYARNLGIAFQIADDLLNLQEDLQTYGKECEGDLWEGKRTLMLLHALRVESDTRVIERATQILAKPRPGVSTSRGAGFKSEADVKFLLDLIRHNDGEAFARGVASEHTERASQALAACESQLARGEARDFLRALPSYVAERIS